MAEICCEFHGCLIKLIFNIAQNGQNMETCIYAAASYRICIFWVLVFDPIVSNSVFKNFYGFNYCSYDVYK